MARAIAAVAAGLTPLVAGCGGGGGGPVVTVACDDAAFRAQDEELYVTHASAANAIGGDPATLLLDLRRARKALSGYLDAHPPCAQSLKDIAATEQDAIGALDTAIAALARGDDAATPLARARDSLTAAQNGLGTAP